MTRTVTKYLIFLVIFLCACSSVTKTDQEKERELIVSNNIKSITEYATILHLGIEKKEQLHRIKLFNTKGFIIKETIFSADDSIESIVTYEYDKDDNLVLSTSMNADSGILFIETRTYDEKNNRKELYFYLPDGTYKYRNSASWDNKGRMIELDWYWTDGLSAKITYAYDGMKMIEKAEYNSAEKLQFKWRYKYDARENIIQAIQYYPNNIINSKITYEYNKYNQMIKQSYYNGESIHKMVTFAYNKSNLLSAKTEYSPSGRISIKYRNQYE